MNPPVASFPLSSAPVAGTDIGRFFSLGREWSIERFDFTGTDAGHERVRLGLFAGVHGNEPAGTEALLAFLHLLNEQPARAAGYDLSIYPLVNPTGAALGTRENASGRNLNREFWRQSAEPEVVLLEAELKSRRFDGVIALHADDGSEGHYGYSHGRAMEEPST